MRGKFQALAMVGIIVALLLPFSAFATAPIAKEVPDIRNAVSTGGQVDTVLDLDDYVIDPDNRNPNTSAQSPLTWNENGSNTAVGAMNLLSVTVPAGALPVSENVTLSVADVTDTIFLDPIRVHTADVLLGGPLVDDYLVAGDTPASPIPYSWALAHIPGDVTSSTVFIPLAQSATGGGRLYLNLHTGLGETTLMTADGLLQGATEQSKPLAPVDLGLNLKGRKWGNFVNVQDGLAQLQGNLNLSVDATLSGLYVQALSGFSDWVRITVNRTFASGANDSYTVALADLLEGVTQSLTGAADNDATITGALENYGFENLDVPTLLNAANHNAYNTASNAQRTTIVNDQPTSWVVTSPFQLVTGDLQGSQLAQLDVTSVGVPAANYPGATSGRALKVDFAQGQSLVGVLLRHKGISPADYAPGDVLTFSFNMFVDLNYAGAANPDVVNEPWNAPIIAFFASTSPTQAAVNYNYVSYPIFGGQAALLPGFPTGLGGTGGLTQGNGYYQKITAAPILHGKWTRQEVSLRAPVLGQSLNGGQGIGNVADPAGIYFGIAFGRFQVDANLPAQTIWLDNIAVTKCPGTLALAQGATNVPMVSAGFSFQFPSGNVAANPFDGATWYGSAIQMPNALARGTEIFGSFSQGTNSASQAVTPRTPSTFLQSASRTKHSDALNTLYAGWAEDTESDGGDGGIAIIGTGGLDVALNYPTMANNRSLVLAPSPNVILGWSTSNTVFGSPETGAPAFPGAYGGVTLVRSPYLDMRLAASAAVPGLNVNDVTFPGSGGNYTTAAGAAAEVGGLQPNQILGNVSGVFGVRWFARSTALATRHNPGFGVVLANADGNLALQALRNAEVMPSADNTNITGDVWVDDFISGSVPSFVSYERYYNLVANVQAGGRFVSTNQPPTGFVNDLLTNNPGAQLGQVWLFKLPSNGSAVTIQNFVNDDTLSLYNGIFGAPDPADLTAAQQNNLPGRYSSASVLVDEVNLLSVRDSAKFYDEDLTLSSFAN